MRLSGPTVAAILAFCANLASGQEISLQTAAATSVAASNPTAIETFVTVPSTTSNLVVKRQAQSLQLRDERLTLNQRQDADQDQAASENDQNAAQQDSQNGDRKVKAKRQGGISHACKRQDGCFSGVQARQEAGGAGGGGEVVGPGGAAPPSDAPAGSPPAIRVRQASEAEQGSAPPASGSPQNPPSTPPAEQGSSRRFRQIAKRWTA